MMSKFSDLKSFEKKFNTEEKCLKYLYKIRWKNGYRCPRCNCKEKWNVGEFKYKCKKCGYQTTVTAGTLFNRTHIPLKTWFRAIYYISSDCKSIHCGFQDFVGLNRERTVFKMYNMICWAKIKPYSDKLKGTIYLDVIELKGNKTMYFTLAVDLNGIIETDLYENYSFERVNEFIEKRIEVNSKIFCSTYILSKDCENIMYQFYEIKRQQNKTRNILNDIMQNRRKFSKMKFGVYLNCYKVLNNATKNKMPFDEILENAVNMSPLTTDCNPMEYWLEYKKFPKLKYFKIN